MHQAEARAVCGRPTIAVCAAVRSRRQKLTDEMAAGDGLNAIQAPFLAPLCRAGIVADHTLDVVLVHLARKIAVASLADRGRPHRRQPVHGERVGAPAEVRDLAHDGCAARMDAIGKLAQMRNDGIVRDIDLPAAPTRCCRRWRGSRHRPSANPGLRGGWRHAAWQSRSRRDRHHED
jgi:hypothetical protein